MESDPSSADQSHITRRQIEPPHSDLGWREEIQGSKAGNRYIRVRRHPAFERVHPGIVTPRDGSVAPGTRVGLGLRYLRRRILGAPLPSSAELEQRVDVPRGLAIYASDNISSSAYATEETMRVLALAGVSALALTLPITLAVIVVLAIVIVSYFQVIEAYPEGGGSYVVAHENLGPLAGVTAGAALLTDYILTVAVSVSAGVAALISAFPELHDYRVHAAVSVIALMTLVNLRGIRESGKIFAFPAYLYLVAVLGLLGVGMYRYIQGNLPDYQPPDQWMGDLGTEPLALLLILRAFASGAVALTGTEAVSNGVPTFRKPEVRNARITLLLMGTLFATIFLGFSFLADQLDVVPDPNEVQTVNSVIARTLLGDNVLFFGVQMSTALLLLLAGNTAFNGFPLLASILAKDRYLPRQFSYRGDRLAFTGGILLLATIAGFLVWTFEASVTQLIPLYTVGVFLAFTLSQAGLVKRWWNMRDSVGHWQFRLGSNLLGAVVTGVVAVVVGVSKFFLGAWMVLVLIPLLVWLMWQIQGHYRRVREVELAEPESPIDPAKITIHAIVPIANLRLPARQAIAYALAIAPSNRVNIVYVTDSQEEADTIRREWSALSPGGELVVIDSPYRSLLGPLVRYIEAVHELDPEATMTVILPEYVPHYWWEHLLHNQSGLRLKAALHFHRNVVVTSVPFHMR